MDPNKFMQKVVTALKDESVVDIVDYLAEIVRTCPPAKMNDIRIEKKAPHNYNIFIFPKIKIETIQFKTVLTKDSVVTEIVR